MEQILRDDQFRCGERVAWTTRGLYKEGFVVYSGPRKASLDRTPVEGWASPEEMVAAVTGPRGARKFDAPGRILVRVGTALYSPHPSSLEHLDHVDYRRTLRPPWKEKAKKPHMPHGPLPPARYPAVRPDYDYDVDDT